MSALCLSPVGAEMLRANTAVLLEKCGDCKATNDILLISRV